MLINRFEHYHSLLSALDRLKAGERFSIDTETTGLRPWKDTKLRGISFYIDGESWYFPVSHPGSVNWNPRDLAARLNNCKGRAILHNANFDRAVLESIGVKPFTDYRDTVILSWLQDENRPKALKVLGEQMFGIDASAEQRALKELFKGKTAAELYKGMRACGLGVAEAREQSKEAARLSKRTWADLTAKEIHAYAEQDTKLTNDLYLRLINDPEYAVTQPAVQRMHDLQNVVYRMVKRGVQIDPVMVEQQKRHAEIKMQVIREQFPGVNLDSPKQIASLIYETWGLPIKERTDKGEPSTARATLEAMAGSHDGLDTILIYRRLGKSVSTYYDPFLDTMDATSRIHPSVNVVGTVTGRFTYSDPNLQTIPRGGTIEGIKDCFVASPGKSLYSFDLKSAELRFMASLAGEQSLIAALGRGEDIYQLTADRIGTSRQVAKSLVLSWPYGVGPIKFARASGLSVKESRAVIAGFESTYPELSRTMSKLSQYAELHGRLPLLEPGRYRRFVGPSLQYPIPGYTALNAACQGGVADTMGNVMIHADAWAEANGCSLVLQVHDSLVYEVPDGFEQELLKHLQAILDGVNPLSMPLLWEAKPGV